MYANTHTHTPLCSSSLLATDPNCTCHTKSLDQCRTLDVQKELLAYPHNALVHSVWLHLNALALSRVNDVVWCLSAKITSRVTRICYDTTVDCCLSIMVAWIYSAFSFVVTIFISIQLPIASPLHLCVRIRVRNDAPKRFRILEEETNPRPAIVWSRTPSRTEKHSLHLCKARTQRKCIPLNTHARQYTPLLLNDPLVFVNLNNQLSRESLRMDIDDFPVILQTSIRLLLMKKRISDCKKQG